MSSSKLWLSLVVCAVACGGSSFSSGDATGGTGATSSGGDTTADGGSATTSGGQLGSSGHTGRAGSSGKAGSSAGGSTSSGGDTSAAGTSVSSGGDAVTLGGGDAGGGVNGGGAGGAMNGGAGGTVGSGGGSAGTGGAVDCSQTGMLWENYLALVDKAKVCDLKVDGQCTSNSNIVNYGDCPIPVNSKSLYFDQARKALDTWKGSGCTFKITMCLAQAGVLTCQSDGSNSLTGTCGYSPIVAQ